MEFESTLELSISPSTIPKSFFFLAQSLNRGRLGGLRGKAQAFSSQTDASLLSIISYINVVKWLIFSEASVSLSVRWDNVCMCGCEDVPGIGHDAHTLSRWQLLSSLSRSPTQCVHIQWIRGLDWLVNSHPVIVEEQGLEPRWWLSTILLFWCLLLRLKCDTICEAALSREL